MSLKKIPKEKWMTLSEDQKRYYELEYKKEFERNKRLTVVSTRFIALLCVFALFFIGFAMLNAVKEYGQIKDKYGPQAFCYLCGLETHKSCGCVYYSKVYGSDSYKLDKDYFLKVAEDNTASCNGTKIIGSQGNTFTDAIPNITIEIP